MSKLPVYEGTAIRENPPAYAHAVSAVPIGTAPTLVWPNQPAKKYQLVAHK